MSAAPEFTPGPWEIDQEGSSYADVIKSHCAANAFQIAGGDWTIAVALDDGPPGQANVHLILAAPDLHYEGAKAATVMEAIADAIGERGLVDLADELRWTAKSMRKALAKAEGKS